MDHEVTKRKIRNGLRKQAAAVQREKDKVWDKLNEPNRRKRKLSATWTVDSVQDLDAMHGLDLEKEIAEALTAEIDKEILAEINKNAGKIKNT